MNLFEESKQWQKLNAEQAERISELSFEVHCFKLDRHKLVEHLDREQKRFFMLQASSPNGSPEQENFRGQYLMAQRILTMLKD